MIRYLIAALLLLVVSPIASLGQSVQPTVLAELFRNVNCGNCPYADDPYQAYLDTTPGIVLINYNNSNTDAQDTFYLAGLPFTEERDEFYNGSAWGDPYGFIDGYYSGNGRGAYTEWEDNTTTGTQHPLPVIMPTIGFDLDGSGIDTISFSVSGSSGTNVAAYVAIKESKLYYNNPYDYGDPPDTLWNDVFRTMLTPEGGSSFPLSGTHNFSVIYDPSVYIGYTGVPQNMTAVVIIQDVATGANSSHPVEAIGVKSMAPPAAVEAQTVSNTNQLIIPENPITNQGLVEMRLSQPGQAKVVLSDLLGREERTIVDAMMPMGETTISIQSLNLPNGIYFADLQVDGVDVDRVKFAVLK